MSEKENHPHEDTAGEGAATAVSEAEEGQEHVHGPHCNHGHQEPVRNPLKEVGRNDPCPCGSQKKFKKCHGA